MSVVGTVLCALGGTRLFDSQWRFADVEPETSSPLPPSPRQRAEFLCPPCGRCVCECTCDEPAWDSERAAAVQRMLEERAITAELVCTWVSVALCCAVAMLGRNSYVCRHEQVPRFITNAPMSAALKADKQPDILRLTFPGPHTSSRRHGRSPSDPEPREEASEDFGRLRW